MEEFGWIALAINLLFAAWMAAAVIGLIGLVCDCQHQRERQRLTTPLPDAPDSNESAEQGIVIGHSGMTMEGDLIDLETGLVIHRRMKVGPAGR